jgi:hypothetical protein
LENGQYRFVYTRGCQEVPGFEAFGRLRDLDAEYVSYELFPLFANRVLPKARPEYSRYMKWLGLSHADAFEELTRTGGLRATDRLELIACPEPTEDRRYEIRFFSRGLRHLAEECQRALDHLGIGDRLYLMRDEQNDVDAMALMLRTDDPVRLVGYVPRYYSADIGRLLTGVGPTAVTVYVDAVNLDAPLHYRLRCRLTAPWPEGFVSCAGPEFEPMRQSKKKLPQKGADPSDARIQ